MKQGMGKNVVAGRKVEPTARAVSLANVAEIGVKQYRTRSTELYKGKGYQAPAPKSCTPHKSGSQGKH